MNTDQPRPADERAPEAQVLTVRPIPWYFARPMVFILIFLIAGILALPFLWLSTAFRLIEKVIWSLATVVYSAVASVLIVWMSFLTWRIWQVWVV